MATEMNNNSTNENNNTRGKNINKADINRVLHELYVAHELAVYEDIRDNIKYKHDNERMRIILRKSYWNEFKEQLNYRPIELELINELLTDIKKCLDLVIIDVNLKDEIFNSFDIEMMRYLTEQYTNDDIINILRCSGKYVIKAISEQYGLFSNRLLLKLSRENDITALYRGIVNIIGDIVKPITSEQMINNYLDYKREKFKEYILIVGGTLPITTEWLLKHRQDKSETWKHIMLNAFIELLTWKSNQQYPETVFLEQERLNKLKQKYFRLTVSSTLYFLSIGIIKISISIDNTIKQSIKAYITDIINTINNNEQLKDVMKTIVEQLISNIATDIIQRNKRKRKDSSGYQKIFDRHLMQWQHCKNEHDVVTMKIFEDRLTDAALQDSKIRTLISNKVNNYLKDSLWPSAKAKYQPRYPYALSKFKKELNSLKLLFQRIFAHNLLVCMPLYQRILNVNKKQ